jgi:hypothetical protein
VTETFEVGQKVTHAARGDVEVTYGPYDSPFGTRYLVRTGSGHETHASSDVLSAIPEPPAFAIGDKVTTTLYGAGTLVAGPYAGRYSDARWVVEVMDGKHVFPASEALTKVVQPEPEPIKVGDRVRIIRAKWAEEHHGAVGTVTSTSGTWREGRGDKHPYVVRIDDTGGTLNVAELERVEDESTVTHEGVTYDLSAQYRDRDGDVWRLKRIDDVVRARMGRDGDGPVTDDSNTLATVVSHWGPLTRV